MVQNIQEKKNPGPSNHFEQLVGKWLGLLNIIVVLLFAFFLLFALISWQCYQVLAWYYLIWREWVLSLILFCWEKKSHYNGKEVCDKLYVTLYITAFLFKLWNSTNIWPQYFIFLYILNFLTFKIFFAGGLSTSCVSQLNLNIFYIFIYFDFLTVKIFIFL